MNLETPLAELLKAIVKKHGFMDRSDVLRLEQLDRLRMVLVRCGNGRFTCPAQDVDHFCEIIRRDFDEHRPNCDYVRDVSLPAGDPAFRGSFHAHTVEGSYKPERKQPSPPATSGFPKHLYVNSNDECSGTFDGFSVTSDADPGL